MPFLARTRARDDIYGPLFYYTSLSWNIFSCYIAGDLFPTVAALINCLEVNWHLTMEQFPAKICANLWPQRVTVHCYLRTLTAGEIYFHKFVLVLDAISRSSTCDYMSSLSHKILLSCSAPGCTSIYCVLVVFQIRCTCFQDWASGNEDL